MSIDLVERLSDIKKYKPREVCKILNVCYKTLYRYDKNGMLVARRSETDRRYYLASDIKEFIRVHCI